MGQISGSGCCNVTIPALRDTFVSVGILIITGSMKIFETVQQLTGGGRRITQKHS